MGCVSLSKPKLDNFIFKTHTSTKSIENSIISAVTFRSQILIRKKFKKIFGNHKSKLFIIYENSLEYEIEI